LDNSSTVVTLLAMFIAFYVVPSKPVARREKHIFNFKINGEPTISEERYEFIVAHITDMELDALWLYVSDDGRTFAKRREIFFYALRKMLEDGHIKLVSLWSGPSLEGSIDEQLQLYRDAFPKNDIEMDNGLWFLKAEECPAGACWLK
jgi:hypothetical protein